LSLFAQEPNYLQFQLNSTNSKPKASWRCKAPVKHWGTWKRQNWSHSVWTP